MRATSGSSTPVPGAAAPPSRSDRGRPRLVLERRHYLLAAAQMFSGVGIAVGVAVGGLLAEDLTGRTEFAGFSQTASVLGAGLAAIPLSRLAVRRGRRASLTTGFTLALCGAVLIVLAATLDSWPGYFLGMMLFGIATATGLQARFAATDGAPAHVQGRLMSFVVWAQTIGSVAGPNLSEPGAGIGTWLGTHALVGPFVISILAFGLAVCFTASLPRLRPTGGTPAPGRGAPLSADRGTSAAGGTDDPTERGGTGPAGSRSSVGALAALRVVLAHPRATMGMTAVVAGQMMMASVMVMTPIHMHHSGHAIHLVGLVISVHILGMYAFSPVVGWLTDLLGPGRVITVGMAVFALAIGIGMWDATGESLMWRISLALGLIGLAWSCTMIAGSTLLTTSIDPSHRTAVQGTSDACMNFGAAGVTALAGPVLAVGGFLWINAMAACVLAVLVLVCARAGFAWHPARR
ncbi:MFS transporter [Brevibacterium samyangense]|uniref:MFS transporter n=2 Tax=Brevibacterium samyangense TaxID=366888 RepID=A0ABN2TIW3_9MICO